MPSKDVGRMLLQWAVLKTMGPDRWHLAHVADTAHTQFICEEIDAAILKQRPSMVATTASGKLDSLDRVVVADVGAGLGIYALHASRQNGVRAVRCEAGPAMCKLAKAASLAAGGASGTFEVKCMSLYTDSDDDVGDALPPAPLGDAACVVVIDALHPLLSQATCQGLLGRGVIDAISSLRAAQLCDSRTVFVPARYIICAALLYIPPGSCTELLTPPLSRVGQSEEESMGYDVSLFNRFRAKTFEPAQLSFTRMSMVSVPVPIASIDISLCAEDPHHLESLLQDRVVEFPLSGTLPQSGVANGVCMWIDCVGGTGHAFSNAPSDASPHRQAVYMLEKPLQLAGASVSHVRANFTFREGSFSFDFVYPSDAIPLTTTAIASTTVQRWHFPMLQDAERNMFYQRAIAAGVHRGAHVLDIGSGTGLLAMMAADAGAAHVTTCEKVRAVAECAAEIVAANRMPDLCPIRVVPVLSSKLVVGDHLPALVDVIVSEILDCGLLGEGMLPATAHALESLAHHNAVIIPAFAKVTAQLLHVPLQYAPLSWSLNSVPLPSGSADLSAYDVFRSPTYEQYRLIHLQHTKMSSCFHVFDFDFRLSVSLLQGRHRMVEVAASETGFVNCVCFWFRVDSGDESIDTHPANTTTTWKQVFCCKSNLLCLACRRIYFHFCHIHIYCRVQAFQMLATPLSVSANCVLNVCCKHDACKIWFEIEASDQSNANL
jgi:predicted RNA methylase